MKNKTEVERWILASVFSFWSGWVSNRWGIKQCASCTDDSPDDNHMYGSRIGVMVISSLEIFGYVKFTPAENMKE